MDSALPPGIAHVLPELRVGTGAGWPKRREKLLALLEKEMYGPAPAPEPPRRIRARALPSPDPAVTVRVERWHLGVTGPLDVLVALPAKLSKPVPGFVGLNFESVADTLENINHHWGLIESAKRGFGSVAACYESVAPDQKEALIYRSGFRAISLWAWALSRMTDGVEKFVPEIDTGRIAVVGHSRLGKAALLAGARDTRFALTIPSQSGCGGAAPSRGSQGETVQRINTVFPHWFSDRFKKYSAHPESLPFDQHELLACLAPRAVLLCNAQEDTWANPDGQVSALDAARPVWSLLGADPDEKTATFLRPGSHAMSALEWGAYLDFAEKVLR
jgi:hypothetical protein